MNHGRILGLFLLLASASFTSAATFTEDFSTDPAGRGWQVFGDTGLFQWNASNQNLEVTWDSSQPNSYFYHSLGTILAREDGFSVEFDLQLSEAQATNFFELALGLLNLTEATNSDFSRDTGDSPNLFEFDYFPDGGFGPSIDATLADETVSGTNMNDFYFVYDNVPLALGVTYHITLTHLPGELSISGAVLTNGQVYTSLPQVYAGPITDFRLDTFSISSYDANGGFGDSILASGTVDNIVVTLPPPPVQNLSGALSNGLWQAQFTGRTNWLYTLVRTTDLNSWSDATTAMPGVEGLLVLSDTNSPASQAFYRIRATRP
jgi:hypothetical protein